MTFAILAHGADVVVAPSRARTFHTLDALRGVAAIAVLLFHAGFVYGSSGPAEGQIAVDLFFVMSGFIIAHRYDRDFARGLGVGRFTVLRLVRLYPLFLLGLSVGVLPQLVEIVAGVADTCRVAILETFGLGVAMLPSTLALPRLPTVYPLNYAAWSLALEIAVNIGYAATFGFWTIRRLAALVSFAICALVACVVYYGTLNVGFDWDNAPGGLARVLFGFPLGVLMFKLHRREPFTSRVAWWVPIALAIAVFAFDAPVAKPWWELIAVVVLVPTIAAAAISVEPPRAARAACATLGILSYALYSLHAPFVGVFLRLQTHLGFDPTARSFGAALAFTVLLLAFCLVAEGAYDRPARRWLSRRLAPKPPAGPRAEMVLATKN